MRHVIAPILAGDNEPEALPTDDVQYVRDLGLITLTGKLQIANPIYREVIPRELISTTSDTISHEPTWYIDAQGRLDIPALLKGFQEFFREHSEHWIARFSYKEAGPQLLLQAFLQRIVNGGGRIEREYGLGRMRTDLFIQWNDAQQQQQRCVLELKILYRSLEYTIDTGLQQTWEYLDRCGAEEGHLLIFDRSDKSWEEKLFQKQREYQGRTIGVWGM